MKLRLLPARTGLTWVRQGVNTFWRQPLALSGLFFMLMAVMAVTGMVPVIGIGLALLVLPACTLGLMAATREADQGRFPMPSVFFSAFTGGWARAQPMVWLGALYGVIYLLSLGVTALFDGGAFAQRYLESGLPTPQMLQDAEVRHAMMAFALLQLPLSLMFWHAPALVHWHGVPPVKSVFFSLVACLRNFSAFAVFTLAWACILLAAGAVIALAATILGNPAAASAGLLPVSMIIAAMFLTSAYFAFRDCFDPGTADTGDTP